MPAHADKGRVTPRGHLPTGSQEPSGDLCREFTTVQPPPPGSEGLKGERAAKLYSMRNGVLNGGGSVPNGGGSVPPPHPQTHTAGCRHQLGAPRGAGGGDGAAGEAGGNADPPEHVAPGRTVPGWVARRKPPQEEHAAQPRSSSSPHGQGGRRKPLRVGSRPHRPCADCPPKRSLCSAPLPTWHHSSTAFSHFYPH